MNIEYLDSYIGQIRILASAERITAITLVKEKARDEEKSLLTSKAKFQLEEYLEGRIKNFELPLDLYGGSIFHQKVWKELLEIPYGSTVSYLDIAKKLGNPSATRAVGMANGKNPIAIVVPCHRVIGSNGSLVGYAHGTDVKRKLLALENPKEYALNGTLF